MWTLHENDALESSTNQEVRPVDVGSMRGWFFFLHFRLPMVVSQKPVHRATCGGRAAGGRAQRGAAQKGRIEAEPRGRTYERSGVPWSESPHTGSPHGQFSLQRLSLHGT